MPLAPPIDAIQQPAVGIYGLPVGASAGAMVLLTAAQIRAIADLSGYVPYTGATGAVTLGTNGLTCGNITSTNLITSNATTTTTWEVPAGQNLIIRGKAGILTLTDGNQNLTIASTSVTLGTSSGRDLTGCRNLYQANGTTAVLQTIEKTYTSATSREYIQSGWNATDSAYDVGVSYQGSAGGSLQAVRIGNRTAAGVFAGLTVATTGAVTVGGNLIQDVAAATTADKQLSLRLAGVESSFYRHKYDSVVLAPALVIGNAVIGDAAGTHAYFGRLSSNTAFALVNSGGLGISSAQYIGWGSTTNTMRDVTGSWVDTKLFRDAAGVVNLRNGTSPQTFRVTNTYTSATSFGLLDIRANAAQTAYEISSFLGSAGGANLPINIGHRDSAGTFTSALSIATSGAITASGLIKPQQATTAGAPAYVLGAIYFDTTLNKLRIGGASAWETVTSV